MLFPAFYFIHSHNGHRAPVCYISTSPFHTHTNTPTEQTLPPPSHTRGETLSPTHTSHAKKIKKHPPQKKTKQRLLSSIERSIEMAPLGAFPTDREAADADRPQGRRRIFMVGGDILCSSPCIYSSCDRTVGWGIRFLEKIIRFQCHRFY